MDIKRLVFSSFRNIEQAQVVPCAGVNLLYGGNGQGKTNFIEGIWLCTGAKSFRGAKNNEMIRFEQPFCMVENHFDGFGREQSCKIRIGLKKEAFLNGVSLKNPFLLAGAFCAVVFSPCHLTLVDGGPDGRRRFLDSAICQYRPAHIIAVAQYKKIMLQKNCLLKEGETGREKEQLLDIYDAQLASLCVRIAHEREKYCNLLFERAAALYEGISHNSERARFLYQTNYQEASSGGEKWDEQVVREKMAASRRRDYRAGSSTIGPHRDEMAFALNDKAARMFASQGQKRSIVLALKLAECEILYEKTGERPVVLLDDVLSELDVRRQQYLLEKINDQQIFITCCEDHFLSSMKNARAFEIENGRIAAQKDF